MNALNAVGRPPDSGPVAARVRQRDVDVQVQGWIGGGTGSSPEQVVWFVGSLELG